MRVQSEQWRKAAKEAAAVLGGGADPAPRASSRTDKRRLGRRRRERVHGSQGRHRGKGSREQRHCASIIFYCWGEKNRKLLEMDTFFLFLYLFGELVNI